MRHWFNQCWRCSIWCQLGIMSYNRLITWQSNQRDGFSFSTSHTTKSIQADYIQMINSKIFNWWNKRSLPAARSPGTQFLKHRGLTNTEAWNRKQGKSDWNSKCQNILWNFTGPFEKCKMISQNVFETIIYINCQRMCQGMWTDEFITDMWKKKLFE